MLPPLLRKAAEDAGFDLTLGADGEWTRVGVSGLEAQVWVVPARAGALLALGPAAAAAEFQTVTWTDMPLPPGAPRAQTSLWGVAGRAPLVRTLPPDRCTTAVVR